MDLELLGQAAIGVGLIAAGVWNGVQTYRTKHITRAATRTLAEMAPTVHETHRQVTVNRHVSNPPTLLDKVDRVQADLRAAAGMFEGHMTSSADDRQKLWAHVRELERVVGTTPTKGHPDDE